MHFTPSQPRHALRHGAVCLLVVLSTTMSLAQTIVPKIGFADVAYIYSKLPDAKLIEKTLLATQNQLAAQINAKASELDTKYKAYIKDGPTMLDAVKASTVRELEMLQQNLDKLRSDAQTALQQKHEELMAPVIKRIGKGIEETARENQYLVIFSSQAAGEDIILFGDERIDVSDLILKKLGVAPTTATPPPGN